MLIGTEVSRLSVAIHYERADNGEFCFSKSSYFSSQSTLYLPTAMEGEGNMPPSH